MECSAEGRRKWFGETALVLFIVGHSCGGCKSWHCEVPQDMSMMAPANRKNHPIYFLFSQGGWPDGKGKRARNQESRESRGESHENNDTRLGLGRRFTATWNSLLQRRELNY